MSLKPRSVRKEGQAMGIPAQQTLHVVSASNITPGAIVRKRWQVARAEGSERSAIVNHGGEIGRREGALSSRFHELPPLQLHVRGGGLPVSKFLSSSGQEVTKWHWVANVGVNRWLSRKRRARRGDDSESSSAEERNGTDKETLEEQNNSKTNGDEQGADSQESGGEIGEVSGEEAEGESSESSREDELDRNEASLQNEGSKTGFWRKIWEPGQKDEDNTLGAEEELLLQDLESLSFDWKDLLDPSWENLLAVGFTALLTLALLKIFSQLILVVITIVLSALKYTVLAALLLGLLIFLL